MSDKMEQLYVAQINAKMVQMNSRLTSIQNPKSIDQIIKQCDAIFLIIDQFKDIVKACPSINMEPKPEALASMIEKTRDIKATNLAVATTDLNIEKVKAISDEKKRNKLLDEAKVLVIDAKNIVRDPELLSKLEAKMAKLGSL